MYTPARGAVPYYSYMFFSVPSRLMEESRGLLALLQREERSEETLRPELARALDALEIKLATGSDSYIHYKKVYLYKPQPEWSPTW